MEFFNMIAPALQDFLVALIIALGGVLITALNKKKQLILAQTDSEITKYYTELIEQTVADCVATTTQTYVESLKNKNMFTKEAQEEAFEKTYCSVIAILSEDVLEYLNETTDNVRAFLTNKIEASVYWQK